MTSPLNEERTPPYKLAGLVLLIVFAVVVALAYARFQGAFTPKTQLTMVSKRAGLMMNVGSKVTYNGVEIGQVVGVNEAEHDGLPAAELELDVNPKYIPIIPSNVDATIDASTVFGQKYVSFTTPDEPTDQPVAPGQEIKVKASDCLESPQPCPVSTESNTLFETIMSISEKVDPIKLNLTLSAAAEGLTGLGDKFGQSIVNGNAILDELNPQMPQLRHDIRSLADVGDVYANASPDLWDFLDNAVTTSRTLNEQRGDLDAALLASVGFGNTGADIFERGGPYLVRGAADLVPTSELLNEYSPGLFCTIKNFHDTAPIVSKTLGGNGYSLETITKLIGGPNPYVYPDNLPRVNARGGPAGAPGCWQEITRDLWPAPYLVVDTGASIAPYNHFDLGQPIVNEYVWGRQVGENTINP